MPITIVIPLTVVFVCCFALEAWRMYLKAQPRADRWQEFERAILAHDTRFKQVEAVQNGHADAVSDFYARFDTLKGQHYAPLAGLADLRDAMSRLEMKVETNARALENIVAEHNRANERVNQVTQTVSAMAQSRSRI